MTVLAWPILLVCNDEWQHFVTHKQTYIFKYLSRKRYFLLDQYKLGLKKYQRNFQKRPIRVIQIGCLWEISKVSGRLRLHRRLESIRWIRQTFWRWYVRIHGPVMHNKSFIRISLKVPDQRRYEVSFGDIHFIWTIEESVK